MPFLFLEVYEVDYIFSKDNDLKKYDAMSFGDALKMDEIPKDILELIELEKVRLL